MVDEMGAANDAENRLAPQCAGVDCCLVHDSLMSHSDGGNSYSVFSLS
jgi:hypothetical protein